MLRFIRRIAAIIAAVFTYTAIEVAREAEDMTGMFVAAMLATMFAYYTWRLWPPRKPAHPAGNAISMSFDRADGTGAMIATLDYTDAQGRQTRRNVTLHSGRIEEDGRFYINGYCHSAEAYRTFRADRISRMIDADTGEIITDGDTDAALKAVIKAAQKGR